MLYGLVHVRYILTARGMAAMFEKYKAAEFGRCPRVNCGGQACLPVGTSDVPRQVLTWGIIGFGVRVMVRVLGGIKLCADVKCYICQGPGESVAD